MNWLKKITISDLHQRYGAFKLLITSGLVLFVVIILSYKAGNFYQKHQNQLIAEQSERLEKLYQKNEQAKSRLNTLQVELEIERLANQKAQQALRSIEDDHFSLKKELAFYEKIMAPEKQANGIIIDEVEVTPSASDNHYRIRVVLVQQQKSKRFAKGRVDITFAGSLVNRPATINIAKMTELDKNSLAFSFQYFQVIEAEFALPKDFVPEKIDVSAILPAGKWQKSHRLDESYPWKTVKTG
ncbi:hypothetical protein RI845_16760 [Thalassotalea nanhaiensis]|uniref:Uncharacterized protein n=1 Tax=Thalassotalea nanhaiensis TaxID=3065648 RepID=A0ABY9TK63_9GAMM|nr:hypothetical protein RI845_16760 [Colwelliaceae bacterium SQ345]